MSGIAHGVYRKKSPIKRLLNADESAQRRIQHIDHAKIAATQQAAHVSPEIYGDALGKCPATPHGDAQRLAHAAMRAIARHHILGPYTRGLPAIAMTDFCRDPRRVL